MPLLFLLLAVFAVALSAPGFSRQSAPARSEDGRVFTVMTFNIQHGVDGRGQRSLQRAIDVIAAIEPDLVGLQEVTRNHSRYDCEDQPALIANGLRRATGRPWQHVYAQSWFVKRDRACLDRGIGDDVNTEGLAFLAPEPFTSVTHEKLFNGRIGVAVRVPAGRDVPVIVTHLASSARRLDDRVKQVAMLLPWVESFGTPHVIVGDLNAPPEAPELAPLMRAYEDAWAKARAARTSRGVPSGATRVSGKGRVDYVLYTPSGGLRLEWVRTVDTSAIVGVHASDHHPVVASFRLPN